MKIVFLSAAALFLLRPMAEAWDYTGHMLVDQVAYQNVSPKVRSRVGALVATLENKYNNQQPYNFITAGAWMDDMRSMPKYPWGRMHYVDVPFTPAAFPFAPAAPPNVLSAIGDSIAILKDRSAAPAKHAEALGMLMHLVGDVHQPLHCAEWGDRGGNGYFIYGIPFSDLLKKQVPNLHAYWDKAFRFDSVAGKVVELYHGPWPTERPGSGESGLIHDEAAKIAAKFPKTGLHAVAQNDPREWARESYTIACLFVYPPRPHPSDMEVVTLKDEYVHRSHEIACSRIALAGYRLAALLEERFGK